MVPLRSIALPNRRSTGDVRISAGKGFSGSYFSCGRQCHDPLHLRASWERQNDWVVVGEAENGRRFSRGLSELSPQRYSDGFL